MPDLDPVTLARMQFAFTVSFHIIFPTISIGLALFLVIVEASWLRTGDLVYRQIYRFWLNIFAMSFGIGVVTGVVMSFQFGLTCGDVLGGQQGEVDLSRVGLVHPHAIENSRDVLRCSEDR